MAGEGFIEVDHGPGGAPARFAAPAARVTAREPAAVPAALAALDAALAARRLGRRVRELRARLCLRAAAAAAAAGRAAAAAARLRGVPGRARRRRRRRRRAARSGRSGRAGAGPTTPRPSRGSPTTSGAGDIYQVNLTLPMDGRWRGDPAAIAGGAGGAAAGRLRGAGGARRTPVLVSRSPELFFALDGAGGIEARPMKGTAPRDPDPARDAALARGAGGRPEEPGREPDDRRPAAQRHRPDRRDRLGAGAGALRGRALRHRAPDGVAGDRAAACRARRWRGSSPRSFPAAR